MLNVGMPESGAASASRATVLALHWFDVCSPWRVDIPTRRLEQAGFAVRQGHIKQEVELEGIDLLLMHRPNSNSALRVLDLASERGIPVVVDVDDLFLDDALPPSAPFSKVWSPDFNRHEAEAKAKAGLIAWDTVQQATESRVMDRFHECLRRADAVTVTTQTLADAYAVFNPNIHILPNCYDDSNPLWNLPRLDRDTVNIGFAGTDHHLDNLAVLRGALEPVLERWPEARVVEAGGPALLPQLDAPAERLIHLGTLPFATFPLLLQQMDIVLAPLVDHIFMRSKSNIRCMTAGLLQLPVVASPVGPYAEYVQHGVNGFFAETTDEWTTAVERLVADPRLRFSMGQANRQRALEFAASGNAHRWEDIYAGLLGRRRRA